MDDISSWPTVELRTSGVVPFSIDHCWPLARDFGGLCNLFYGMEVAGRPSPVHSSMLGGAESTCIGALRLIDFGNIRMVHQLDSIDDESHEIAWHAVAHPLNRSAFPGSFCNDSYSIKMIPVTMGNVTFVQLLGRFKTEPENVEVMKKFVDNMQETAVSGIGRCLLATLSPTLKSLRKLPLQASASAAPQALALGLPAQTMQMGPAAHGATLQQPGPHGLPARQPSSLSQHQKFQHLQQQQQQQHYCNVHGQDGHAWRPFNASFSSPIGGLGAQQPPMRFGPLRQQQQQQNGFGMHLPSSQAMSAHDAALASVYANLA